MGSQLSLAVIPNDPFGNAGLSYAWSSNPAGGNFATVTSPISTWTAPLATGIYQIQCSVSDGIFAATATQQVSVISNLPMTSPGRISGYIRDVNTGAPIPGALVVISGTDLSAISGLDGYFQFSGVLAGTYTLIATRNGFQARTFTGVVVPAM
ncbi:MAG: carboxypeptidase-like regulatory domain-containing protein [Candidatus Riflebacteria bacterium]|nr:carboxypeptidase-like regulatory domain-containing protein [Candidatus Riflebacteria bacterium]